ncbi:MAG: LptF/LptG family permease [Planctomycetota bacterium]
MSRLPWTLYRYIGKELLLAFLLSISVLTLILAIVAGIRAVDAGFRISVVMPWILQNIAYSWYFTVPVALLVTSALTYGRVASDREYTACCASGVSPLHLYAPMLALSGIITIIAMATQGTLLPDAHYSQRNIARYLVKQLEHLGNSTGQQVIELKDGRVAWKENQGNYLRDVEIHKMIAVPKKGDLFTLDGEEEVKKEEEQVPLILLASAAQVTVADDIVYLDLFDVSIAFGNPREGSIFADTGYPKYFEMLEIERKKFQVPINEKRKREGDMTTAELGAYYAECEETLQQLRANPPPATEEERLRELAALEAIVDLNDEQLNRRDQLTKDAEGVGWTKQVAGLERRLRKIPAELWERRALALTALAFALLGFPIALTIRYRHRMAPLFLSGTLAVAVYYPLLLAGQNMAVSGTIPASFALLFGNIVLFGISAVLIWKMLFR